MAAPSSQKADVRPISFVLWDKPSGAKPIELTLAIRPEDLTRSDPSRVTVQQTLESPWIDSFGEGLSQITISGHTGWREGTSATGTRDGIGRYIELRDQVYKNWHSRRDAAMQAGKNPDGVELIFSDSLDRMTDIVVPLSFVLRRSKSSPLLCRYNITMLAVADKLDEYGLTGQSAATDPALTQGLGLDSLTASVTKISTFFTNINSYVQGTLVAPLKSYVGKTVALLNATNDMVRSVNSISNSAIQIAQLSTQAGANIMHSLANVANLPSTTKQKLMEVGAAYTNAFCVLSNSLNIQQYYQDYSPILGASNCSSTSGGAPLSRFAGTNTFASVLPLPTPIPVAVTPQGSAALKQLAGADLVLAPMSPVALESAVTQADSGMTVNA